MAELKTTTIHGNLIIEDGNAIICNNPKIFSSLEEYEKHLFGGQEPGQDENTIFGIQPGSNGEIYGIANKELNIDVNTLSINVKENLLLNTSGSIDITNNLVLNSNLTFSDGFTEFVPNNGSGKTIGIKRKTNKVSLNGGVPNSDIPDDISKAPYLPITAVTNGSDYEKWLLVDLKDKGRFFDGIRIQSPNQEGLLWIGASADHNLTNSTFFNITVTHNTNTKDVRLFINDKQFLKASTLKKQITMSDSSYFETFVIGNTTNLLNTVEFNARKIKMKNSNITFTNPPTINGHPIFSKEGDTTYQSDIILTLSEILLPEKRPITYIPGVFIGNVDGKVKFTDEDWKKFREKVLYKNGKFTEQYIANKLRYWLISVYYGANSTPFNNPIIFQDQASFDDWYNGNNGSMFGNDASPGKRPDRGVKAVG